MLTDAIKEKHKRLQFELDKTLALFESNPEKRLEILVEYSRLRKEIDQYNEELDREIAEYNLEREKTVLAEEEAKILHHKKLEELMDEIKSLGAFESGCRLKIASLEQDEIERIRKLKDDLNERADIAWE